MFIPSRTPEGRLFHCPLCGREVCMEPSPDSGDALCPHCGQLLWRAPRYSWLRRSRVLMLGIFFIAFFIVQFPFVVAFFSLLLISLLVIVHVGLVALGAPLGDLELPLLVLVGTVIEVRYVRPLWMWLMSQFFERETRFVIWLIDR